MEVRTTGVPVIGEKELQRAAEILRRYKQGRQNLERRIIADEDWWKLRQWRQFADKGNPNDDRSASGWSSLYDARKVIGINITSAINSTIPSRIYSQSKGNSP